MNVYKVELLIVDFDSIGKKEIKEVLECDMYPNHCMYPAVMSIESRTVDWSDDHPLNYSSTRKDAYENLFKENEK